MAQLGTVHKPRVIAPAPEPRATAVQQPEPSKKNRAYHNKVRTGCKTCKIRRIRCDEGKPACKRCLTTGRKCDGYVTATAEPFPRPPNTGTLPTATFISPHAASDLILLQSKRTSDELRSYTYFKEVTAPTLAGSPMSRDFWVLEVPRTCESNEAIWHAALGLASAHEAYFCRQDQRRSHHIAQTLRHLNASIRALTVQNWSSRKSSWEALTASTMFSCTAMLSGRLDEAKLHFRSGCKLLQELEADAATVQLMPERDQLLGPISLTSIRSLLIGFEMVESKMDPNRVSVPPKLLAPEKQDNYSAWQRYSLPASPTVFGGYASPDSLSQATRAAESLFMTLVISAMAQATVLKKLYDQGGYDLLRSTPKCEDPIVIHDSFRALECASSLFASELNAPGGPKMRPSEATELRKAYISLLILQTSTRMLLRSDPYEPDPQRRLESLPKQCSYLMDRCEEVLALETTVGCLRDGGPVATPPLMNSIVYMVKTGFHKKTRDRALQLLRKPRLEGVWDSCMSAALAEEMMMRESEASREYRKDPFLRDFNIDHPSARGWIPAIPAEDDEDEVHIVPLARICNYTMVPLSAREAILTLRTWKEWFEGSPGKNFHIQW